MFVEIAQQGAPTAQPGFVDILFLIFEQIICHGSFIALGQQVQENEKTSVMHAHFTCASRYVAIRLGLRQSDDRGDGQLVEPSVHMFVPESGVPAEGTASHCFRMKRLSGLPKRNSVVVGEPSGKTRRTGNEGAYQRVLSTSHA